MEIILITKGKDYISVFPLLLCSLLVQSKHVTFGIGNMSAVNFTYILLLLFIVETAPIGEREGGKP